MLNLFKFKNVRFKISPFILTVFASIFLLIFSVFDSSFISVLKINLSQYALDIKYFANKIIKFPQILSKYSHIKKENSELREQIENLKTKISELQNAEFEIDKLKKSVGLKYAFSNFKHMERVLGFDKSPYESFMIISAADSATLPGKIVISSDGLVGVVTDGNGKIARVTTICDKTLSVSAKTENERFIISGIGENQMESKETKKNIESAKLSVNLGEILYTSGEGGFFPSDIPIARITKIDWEANGVFAVPLSNMADLSYVWIISPIGE